MERDYKMFSVKIFFHSVLGYISLNNYSVGMEERKVELNNN